MDTKICFKCKKDKELPDFNKDNNRKDGHRVYCRECEHEEGIIYRKTHSDDIRRRHRERYRLNPERAKQYQRDHKIEANAIKKKYVENHPEKRKESAREWYYRNKDKVKERNKECKEKINKSKRLYMQNNPSAKFAHNFRTRLGRLLKGESEDLHMLEIIGCDLDFFINHIKSRFKDGMCLENYGLGDGKWVIDHDPPLVLYDHSDINQVKEAWNYTRLFPLWWRDNLIKGTLYNGKRYYHKKS